MTRISAHNDRWGHIIRERRKELKLSQKELALRVGISRNYVSLIENGHTNNPSMRVMLDIEKALDISLSRPPTMFEEAPVIAHIFCPHCGKALKMGLVKESTSAKSCRDSA